MRKNTANMKIHSLAILFLALVLATGTQSCIKDQCSQEVSYYVSVPVYKSLAEIRTGISNEAPRALANPGKIYFYNDYVFVNELHEGIHIIDNHDPKNPVITGFLAIPGNVDMAVQNGILYADNFIDLLAIDITTPESATVLHRSENIFPSFGSHPTTGDLLVYYDNQLITEHIDCSSTSSPLTLFEERFTGNIDVVFAGEANDNSTGGTGVGGSMARFTLAANHLYVVDQFNLRAFSLANPQQPALASDLSIGWGIETIFPYGSNLFIGSSTGMFIYDISNPASPAYMSQFAHVNACDPVFVDGDLAYVTLRDGNFCQGFTNQLDIINVADLRNPYLVESFDMDNPHGLSIDGDNLYLCEGEYGLKIFDIEDPFELKKNLIDHIKGIHAYDVISVPGQEDILLLIGKDGFYQYDVSNPSNLKQLSKIGVEN